LSVFLSRFVLDLGCPRTRRELSNIYELHRTILRAFPDDTAGGPGRVLFRVEKGKGDGVMVLVQSQKEPIWDRLDVPKNFYLQAPEKKEYDPHLVKGQRLLFRLTANPTVRKDGKRLGLVREEDLRVWMNRKAERGGYSLQGFRIVPHLPVEGEKASSSGENLKFISVTYEGILQVEDSGLFRMSIESGVGSGKAFGFGLLSIAPIR
jgi:CRISPR system Cascade subunit CasE